MRKIMRVLVAMCALAQVVLAVALLVGSVVWLQRHGTPSASSHDMNEVLSAVQSEELNPRQRSLVVEVLQADQRTIVALEDGMRGAVKDLRGVALFLLLLPVLLLVGTFMKSAR